MLPKQNAKVGKSFKAPNLGLKKLSVKGDKFSTDKMSVIQLPFVTFMKGTN